MPIIVSHIRYHFEAQIENMHTIHALKKYDTLNGVRIEISDACRRIYDYTYTVGEVHAFYKYELKIRK